MSTKTIIWVFVLIGSSLGSCLPLLWGGSLFSFSSLFASAVGGIIGLTAGIKIANMING